MGNRAETAGGGLAGPELRAFLDRTILWGNCADSAGAQAFLPDATSSVSFLCSNVDSSGVIAIDLTYDGPQVFQDPQFCAPATCFAAPTAAGDYTLSGTSPLLPASSPCGTLIGVNGQGCSVTAAGPGPTTPKPTLSAHPNPFRGALEIGVSVPTGEVADLVVYDVRGRLVRRMTLGLATRLTWDGRDASGIATPAGVYFLRLRSASVNATQRVVRVP